MVLKVSESPYTSPEAPEKAAPPNPPLTMAQSSFRYGAIGLAIAACTFGASLSGALRSFVPLGVLIVLIMSLIGGLLGVFSMGLQLVGRQPRDLLRAIMGIAMNLMAGAVSTAGMMLVANFIRGRQLRRWGQLKFAHLKPQSGWSSTSEGPRAPEAIAAAWRKNGLTEHASIAAFSHLCAELIALGAPPELIEASQKDALDELEHTKLCFALARKLDGQDLGPGRFSEAARPSGTRGPKVLRLSRLAVESLLDGAINEGISARVIAQLSKSVEDQRVQRVLRKIASDEARHAAHGFQVMRWCLQEGGQPVALTLAKTISKLPEKLGDGLHPGAADGRWEAWGLPSQAREQRAYREVRGRIIAKTQRLLDRAT